MPQHSLVRISLVGLSMLVAQMDTASAYSTPLAPCSTRLIVELTPDVPDPRDPEFLSSLLSNHPAYRLIWIRREGSSEIVLRLTGPGTDEQCHAVIDTLRKDGRVLSVRSEREGELDSVVVTSKLTPPEIEPALYLERAGLGSLYWAALHPGRALQILLPVRANDPTGARADLSAACRTTDDFDDHPPECP